MYQSSSNDGGGIQRCIRDALMMTVKIYEAIKLNVLNTYKIHIPFMFFDLLLFFVPIFLLLQEDGNFNADWHKSPSKG